MIEQHGGKNVGSISSKTSFVLAGANMGPAKLEKAGKLGIPILSEEEFLKKIESWKIVCIMGFYLYFCREIDRTT